MKKAKDKANAEAIRQADLKETETICQVFRDKDKANGLVPSTSSISTNTNGNHRGAPPKKTNVSPATRAKMDRKNELQNARRKKVAVSVFPLLSFDSRTHFELTLC